MHLSLDFSSATGSLFYLFFLDCGGVRRLTTSFFCKNHKETIVVLVDPIYTSELTNLKPPKNGLHGFDVCTGCTSRWSKKRARIPTMTLCYVGPVQLSNVQRGEWSIRHDFRIHGTSQGNTLPEPKIFAPKNGWLEYDPFLLGWPIFRCELLVSGRVFTDYIDPINIYQDVHGSDRNDRDRKLGYFTYLGDENNLP